MLQTYEKPNAELIDYRSMQSFAVQDGDLNVSAGGADLPEGEDGE